jgi:hypothetical protein
MTPGQTHADTVFANDRRCHRSSLLVLRALDRHRDADVTSLIPMLSCRSCRPNGGRPPIANEYRRRNARAPSPAYIGRLKPGVWKAKGQTALRRSVEPATQSGHSVVMIGATQSDH